MTDDQAVTLIRAIREHAGLELASIRDAGTHGADGGFGGFTYYGDTSEFYSANRSLLWEILAEDASEFGYDSVPAFVASFNRAELAVPLSPAAPLMPVAEPAKWKILPSDVILRMRWKLVSET